MSGETGFKANFLVLTPTAPAAIPNNSIFFDSSNSNTPSVKDGSGNVHVVQIGKGMLVKQMEASGPISLYKPVSKLANGKIEQADSDAPTGQKFIGFAMQAASMSGDLIDVLCVGANFVNAVATLGFAPGDEVYLSETGGFTNNPLSFTGVDDSIIKVGIADCSAGLASGVANDLIVFPEVVARP